jgi:hypothetical protein
METVKIKFRPAEEIIAFFKESKKQSEIETREYIMSKEFQDDIKKLRAMNKVKNGL